MLLPTSSAFGAAYPLREKWVFAETQHVDAHLPCCRSQHHRPTSDEVGMRENLTPTLFTGSIDSFRA